MIGTGRAGAEEHVLALGADRFVDVAQDGRDAVGDVELVYDTIGGEVLALRPRSSSAAAPWYP